MEISIHPDELRAAATALSACAGRLDSAGQEFAHHAIADAVGLGVQSFSVAARGCEATMRAVETLELDLRRIAQALNSLADRYPEVDRSAVPQP